MDEFINVSHVFINDITISGITITEEKKKKFFYNLVFFIPPLSSTHPRFRNRNAALNKG